MLKVTKKAAQTLKNLLESNQVDPAKCFCLVPKEESGTYGFDFVDIHSADYSGRMVESEGTTILIVGNEDNERVSGMALDVVESEDGRPTVAIMPDLEPTN